MNSRRKANKSILSELVQISKEIKPIESAERKYKNILFCPLNATEMNTIRESILAMSVKLRGANPKMLFLDTNLDKSEFYANKKEYLIYKFKLKSNISTSKKMGLDVVKTSTYSRGIKAKLNLESLSGEELEKYEYKGIFLGDLITASTVRTYLSNGPEWDRKEFKETAIQNVKSAVKLVDLYIKLLEAEQPDKLVMTHGIYISWGPLFRVARRMNIPVDVYGSSYRKNTLRFYHNSPNAPFPEAEWPTFKNQSLKADELTVLDSYIASREDQSQDNVSLFTNPDLASPELQEFIKKNEDKKLFCMFTNIAWDAFAFSAEGRFSDMFDWIEQTLEFFKNSDKSALILKAHPAEDHWDTPEEYRVRSLVKKLGLSENVYFVSENEKLKPFWLYDKIDWGIIHISTVAIEMALKNIPVLTSGAGGHYSNNGFTLDPTNTQEYFDYLKSIEEGKNEYKPDIDAAKRYMYYRFFREAIPFDMLELKNLSWVERSNIKSVEDLKPGKFKSLDIIVDGILNDSAFVYC